jgi:hypothetical protein
MHDPPPHPSVPYASRTLAFELKRLAEHGDSEGILRQCLSNSKSKKCQNYDKKSNLPKAVYLLPNAPEHHLML